MQIIYWHEKGWSGSEVLPKGKGKRFVIGALKFNSNQVWFSLHLKTYRFSAWSET